MPKENPQLHAGSFEMYLSGVDFRQQCLCPDRHQAQGSIDWNTNNCRSEILTIVGTETRQLSEQKFNNHRKNIGRTISLRYNG